MEAKGKAAVAKLEEEDVLLSVNGIACSELTEAQQLIHSAFQTLTLNIWR